MRNVALAFAGALALAGFTLTGQGCSGDSTDDRTLGIYTLAITDSTPAAIAGAESSTYQVSLPIALPLVARPTLADAPVAPYPRPVWYPSSEIQIQLAYVITNLSDTEAKVELLVDGWNEFIRYTPRVQADADGNVNADRSMDDRLLIIPPKGRVEGRISYDDFERMAVALAVIMKGETLASFNPIHVVEPHTRLYTDPETAGLVPSVIDGMTGFDLSLRAGGKVKVALEATLEIVDHGQHLVPKGEVSPAGPPGTRYNPVVKTPPKP